MTLTDGVADGLAEPLSDMLRLGETELAVDAGGEALAEMTGVALSVGWQEHKYGGTVEHSQTPAHPVAETDGVACGLMLVLGDGAGDGVPLQMHTPFAGAPQEVKQHSAGQLDHVGVPDTLAAVLAEPAAEPLGDVVGGALEVAEADGARDCEGEAAPVAEVVALPDADTEDARVCEASAVRVAEAEALPEADTAGELLALVLEVPADEGEGARVCDRVRETDTVPEATALVLGETADEADGARVRVRVVLTLGDRLRVLVTLGKGEAAADTEREIDAVPVATALRLRVAVRVYEPDAD